MQPEKCAPGLGTADLVMSRAEVECRGGAGVDSGHDLLVGNDGVGSTSKQRDGEGRIGTGTGHGATRWSGRDGGFVTPLVLRARLAPRFRPKKNFRNEFLGFLI